MHKGHSHPQGHEHHGDEEGSVTGRKLLALLEHWVEHSDSHVDSYREWAQKASEAGEEEIAREMHLAIQQTDTARDHLKRAKAVLAAKLAVGK